MLYAVSGSQGSGKTTVLAALKDRGHNVLERKTSRSILADWNITLNQVNTDKDLTLKFQDEILLRKYSDELDAATSPEVYFTERTYFDAFVYYLFAFGKMEEFDTMIRGYYEKCRAYNVVYSNIFFLPSGKFATVADGVRGVNPQYVESVDNTIRFYLEKNCPDQLHIVEPVTVEDRIAYIEKVIDNSV